MDPLDILIRYRKVRRHRDFDLRKFVENHFWLPEVYSSEYVSDPQNSLKEHIDQLWPVLTREPQDHIPWSSLLALPQSYIVPGGRFSETYYWDSYFTMLGLAESGREDLLKCMADNFAWMIDHILSRAAVLAKPTIGIPISPCWGWRKVVGKIC